MVKNSYIVQGLISKGNNQKGIVLIIVMTIVALIAATVLYLGDTLKQDIHFISRIKSSEQAFYVAEAGVNHAIGKIKDGSEFASLSDFTGTMDTGSYAVSFSTIGGRKLITSAGTVGGHSKSVSVEVSDPTSTFLVQLIGSVGDVAIRARGNADVTLTGALHSNNDIELRTSGASASIKITGTVSATNTVLEGSTYHASDGQDKGVYINGVNNDAGTVTEGAPRRPAYTFPYQAYKQEAIDSGDYYDTSATFTGATLSPSNGIVYVNGTATFEGTSTLNGGIIANAIDIEGTLNQAKTGHDRNIIVASETDILIGGRLETEEALVFAERDIRSKYSHSELVLTGSILSKGALSFSDVQSNITYNYILTYPSDLLNEDGEDLSCTIVSWNP
jgi:hypothetical protein